MSKQQEEAINQALHGDKWQWQTHDEYFKLLSKTRDKKSDNRITALQLTNLTIDGIVYILELREAKGV